MHVLGSQWDLRQSKNIQAALSPASEWPVCPAHHQATRGGGTTQGVLMQDVLVQSKDSVMTHASQLPRDQPPSHSFSLIITSFFSNHRVLIFFHIKPSTCQKREELEKIPLLFTLSGFFQTELWKALVQPDKS